MTVQRPSLLDRARDPQFVAWFEQSLIDSEVTEDIAPHILNKVATIMRAGMRDRLTQRDTAA